MESIKNHGAENLKIHVIAAGYNCKEYVSKCVASVLNQTHQNFHLHVINDGSTDGTGAECQQYAKHSKITVYDYSENKAAAYRRMQAIRPLPDDDVILLLGLDDELLPDCLQKVSEQYASGKWMTYANWKDQHGNMLPASFNLDFDEETHRNRNYRKVLYRSTAPNTFKKFLFNEIPDTDFQLHGKWIDTTTESELMFSCLEMCGKERIGIIKEPIYMYNRNRKGGTLQRLGSEYKQKVLAEMIKRPKKKPYEKKAAHLTVGLPVLDSPLAWLAMESLCRQNVNVTWELIVYEDANNPNGEKFYQQYLHRLPNCKRIIYIYDKERVSLSRKWCEMTEYADQNSIGLVLQAADCYSEPTRLQRTYEAFLQEYDWVHSEQGCFYNIPTGEVMLFRKNPDGLTGLNMALRMSILKQIQPIDRWSGIDWWLFTEGNKIAELKVFTDQTDNWKHGVDTDGFNKISHSRRTFYRNPQPPFYHCSERITNILPADILRMFKTEIKIREKLSVLSISTNDWANYSYDNSRALLAAGVNVVGLKNFNHSFGYEGQHPVVTREQMREEVSSGKYNVLQIFNSDVTMLEFARGFSGKVVVYHTGSGYRMKYKTLNPQFNPVVHQSIIALGEFAGLGAKNEVYVSVAVDTDKIKAKIEEPLKRYTFLHCPSNPDVKGTNNILKMTKDIRGLSFRHDTKILPHQKSIERMKQCDIYIELFKPKLGNDKYGSFGTTAVEAAALGKVVVTQNLSAHVYEKYYGECPLFLAVDEQDFVKKIQQLLRMKPEELLTLQQQHRNWAVEKHSYEATGQRLKQILET